MTVQSRAKVIVTLEIDLGAAPWNGECHVSQVHRDATDKARMVIDEIATSNPSIRAARYDVIDVTLSIPKDVR